MIATKSSLIETLTDGLKVLPETFCLTPVNGNKEAYLTGWTKEGFSPNSSLLLKEIKSGKAKGYGLVTGKLSSGIVAVDCDGKAAHELAEKLGGLPHTVGFTSGVEGRAQYLYQIPSEFWGSITTKKINTGKVGSNGKEVLLELRWNGCQSVLPPSVHPETKQYKWINSIENTAIAQAPYWVIEEMLVTPEPTLTPIEKKLQEPVHPSSTDEFYDPIPLYNCLSLNERDLIDHGVGDGNRNNTAKKLILGLLGCEAYLRKSDIRFSGTARQLYDDFCDRCNPPLSTKERESLWKFGEKANNPKASLPGDAIENCVKAWKKRNSNGSSNGSSNGKKRSYEPTSSKTSSYESEDEKFEETPKLIRAFEKAKREIGNRIRLNLMNHDIELDGSVLDLECLELELALEIGLDLKVGSKQLEGIIFKIARMNAYNPIKDYLEACNKKHKDTRILEKIAERYFGVSDEIYQTYIRKMLIAAVARIYQPGCQQDNTLILQSKGQGIGKSTFFKVLSGETYFCDDMGDFKEKDERLKLHQNWFLEWGELEKITSKKAAGAIKSFLSTREDQIRPPYARKAVKMPRQSILVGTANPQEILFDPTGSRRYWVIPVSQKIPLDLLEAERDQIWGAAVEVYKNGEQWWLDTDQQIQSEAANENFQVHSFIQNEIEDFLLDKSQVTTRELLDFVVTLGFSIDNPQVLKTVEQQIKAAITRLKWEPCRLTIDGKRPRGYRSPVPVTEPIENNAIPNNSECVPDTAQDETFQKMDEDLINHITNGTPVKLTTQQKDALTLFESVPGLTREKFIEGWHNLNERGQRHFIEILLNYHPKRVRIGDRLTQKWLVDLEQIRKKENFTRGFK